MNTYELNFTKDRQAAILREVTENQLVREAKSGQPTVGQRMIVAAGEALESAGGWLKRRGDARRGFAEMGRGLSVSR